jgi:hypothetical protein
MLGIVRCDNVWVAGTFDDSSPSDLNGAFVGGFSLNKLGECILTHQLTVWSFAVRELARKIKYAVFFIGQRGTSGDINLQETDLNASCIS